ncbi:MAG: hypothetical protein ACI4ML_12120 [Aristaeellaceae bacterium]
MEILAAVGLAAAIFAAGLMLMNRVDRWLRAAQQVRDGHVAREERSLRIGVCDPMAAGSLSETLAGEEQAEQGVPVRLLCGTEMELLRAMRERRLDLALLPESVRDMGEGIHACPVQLRRSLMLRGGVREEPLMAGPVRRVLVWTAAGAAEAECLLRAWQSANGRRSGEGGNVV